MLQSRINFNWRQDKNIIKRNSKDPRRIYAKVFFFLTNQREKRLPKELYQI